MIKKRTIIYKWERNTYVHLLMQPKCFNCNVINSKCLDFFKIIIWLAEILYNWIFLRKMVKSVVCAFQDDNWFILSASTGSRNVGLGASMLYNRDQRNLLCKNNKPFRSIHFSWFPYHIYNFTIFIYLLFSAGMFFFVFILLFITKWAKLNFWIISNLTFEYFEQIIIKYQGVRIWTMMS